MSGPMILLCYVKNVIQRFMHTGNYTNLEKGLDKGFEVCYTVYSETENYVGGG